MPTTNIKGGPAAGDPPALRRIHSRLPLSVKSSRPGPSFPQGWTISKDTSVEPRLQDISHALRKPGCGSASNLDDYRNTAFLMRSSTDLKDKDNVRSGRVSWAGRQSGGNMSCGSRVKAPSAPCTFLTSKSERDGSNIRRRAPTIAEYASPMSKDRFNLTDRERESRPIAQKDTEHCHASHTHFAMTSLQNHTRTPRENAIHVTKSYGISLQHVTSNSASGDRPNMSVQHHFDLQASAKSSMKSPASSPFSLQSAPSSITSYSSVVSPEPKVKHNQARRVPLELAHLDVDIPARHIPSRRTPPVRPSRDGAPDLWESHEVPKSEPGDVRAAETYVSKRDSGLASPLYSQSISLKPSSGSSSRNPSRQDIPRQATASPDSFRGSGDSAFDRRDSPMASAKTSPGNPARIGFLPPRSQDKSSGPVTAKHVPRRGPAAGTGHEGYAKVRFRPQSRNTHSSNFGRSTSANSTDGFARVPSGRTGSFDDDQSSFDNFLDARAEPVVLRGVGNIATLPVQNARKTHGESGLSSSPTIPDLTQTGSPASQATIPSAEPLTGLSASCATGLIANEPLPAELDNRPSVAAKKDQEGYQMRTSKARVESPSPTSFARRLFGKKPSSSTASNHGTGKQAGLEKATEYEAADESPAGTSMSEISTNVQLLVDANIDTRSDRDDSRIQKAETPTVAFDRRHEGLMPALPEVYKTDPVHGTGSMSNTAQKPTPADDTRLHKLTDVTRSQQCKANILVSRWSSIGRVRPTNPLGEKVQRRSRGHISRQMKKVQDRQRDTASESMLTVKGSPSSPGIKKFFEFPSHKKSDILHFSSSGVDPHSLPNDFSLHTEDRWSGYDGLCDAESQHISPPEPGQGGDESLPENGRRAAPPAEQVSHNMLPTRPLASTESCRTYERRFESFAPVGSKKLDPGVGEEPKADSTYGTRGYNGEFRHAAMVTSKWLYFGRILFSPVHEEAKSGNDAKVLIIDGLGTEWSYYCALNYPACQFYHLGPEASSPASNAVPNYHHIPHKALSLAIPFPRSFFSGAVLRFPKVSSDESYSSCMSEIKRTLRPGGYFEISTVDLDLVNMGSKARKAVKDLKLHLHQYDDQLSLWNQGDGFLKLLGRRGFESVQSCVVALPAAGKISSSGDSTRESDSQRTSWHDLDKHVDGPGLSDLLRNKTHDSSLDEQITTTVARVGRWWYSNCYEEMIPGLDGLAYDSIWKTPGLIRDMERHGTSLKLLICFAQKPPCVKRRTASI